MGVFVLMLGSLDICLNGDPWVSEAFWKDFAKERQMEIYIPVRS
jgi:hypothetical protein